MIAKLQRNIVAGIFIVIPIWVTVRVIAFLVEALVGVGGPAGVAFVSWIKPSLPGLASLFAAEWFVQAMSAVIVLTLLLTLGIVGRAVIGRRLLDAFDALMGRIPVVQSIYGSTRKLIATVQSKPNGHQRVVLIRFPSPGMMAVGLVTRTFVDSRTGEDIAAVYVPTTPNPSSGYVELVPTRLLEPLDWTVNEALTFVISGGAVAPERSAFSLSRAT